MSVCGLRVRAFVCVCVCGVSVVVAMIADCFNHMVLLVVCIVMFLCNELNTTNFAVRGTQYY